MAGTPKTPRFALIVLSAAAAAFLLVRMAPRPQLPEPVPPAPNAPVIVPEVAAPEPVIAAAPKPTRPSEPVPEPKRRRSAPPPAAAPEPTDHSDEAVYGHASGAVVAVNNGDRWVAQGDILVSPDDLSEGDEDVAVVLINAVKYWQGGVVPYVADSDIDEARLLAAFTQFHERTSVRFVPHAGEPDYLRFRTADADTCESYLGRRGGEQDVLLGGQCKAGQVMHELMHALGFVHEQSRADRDAYVSIYWDRIEPPKKNQFQMLPAVVSTPVAVPFDFESILLYPSNAFGVGGAVTMARKDGTTFGANRERLSDTDVERVNALYPPPS